MSHMIISLMQSIHMHHSWHDSDVTASVQYKTNDHGLSMPRRIKLKIIVYHLCHIIFSEHCCVNLESGVNFQVVLKQNHAKRNYIKRNLPVYGGGAQKFPELLKKLFDIVIQV